MSGMVSIRSLTCEGQVILSTRHMKRRNVIERKDDTQSSGKTNNTSSSVNDFLVIFMFIQSSTTKVVQCRCLIYVEHDSSNSTYLYTVAIHVNRPIEKNRRSPWNFVTHIQRSRARGSSSLYRLAYCLLNSTRGRKLSISSTLKNPSLCHGTRLFTVA